MRLFALPFLKMATILRLNKLAEKYDPIIHAIENVYQINFKNHDLRNYIYRATHN
jgi:hypothetical protein